MSRGRESASFINGLGASSRAERKGHTASVNTGERAEASLKLKCLNLYQRKSFKRFNLRHREGLNVSICVTGEISCINLSRRVFDVLIRVTEEFGTSCVMGSLNVLIYASLFMLFSRYHVCRGGRVPQAL